jgi:hypothetical protein
MTDTKHALPERKCLKAGCKKTMPTGSLYCDEHIPDNFDMESPDGSGAHILWKDHPRNRNREK